MDETQEFSKSSTKSWTKDKKILYFLNDNSSGSPKRSQASQSQAQSTADTKNVKSHHAEHRHNRREHRRVASLDENNDNDHQSQQQQPNPTNSGANTTIIGHYELKKTLGKGNFSTVKLAQHRITNHSVAIKVVKISVLSEDNLMKVNREIDVLKKLGKHDHIVRLYQVIKTKRYFMLVTEYCADGELYDYLVDKGKLSEPQSCDFFLQILSAIEYLHNNNVVHRDLKAENLLLTNSFKTVKIADFGFANYYKRDKLLSTWCGSPPYAAPELFKGLQYVGPPVDIWSMGVILYVLVCGSLPFDGHNLVYLKSRVLSGKFRIPFFMSTECEGLVRGMLRLDPERRYSIRQIRAHTWMQKHGKLRPASDTSMPAPAMSLRNKPNANNTDDLKNPKASSVDKPDSDKDSGANRGQSLDLEDDRKQRPSNQSTKDASMLYLTSSIDTDQTSESRADPQKEAQTKLSKMHNFVNTEIANAVSNMSIDSNNSSMSVSHSYDISNTSQSVARSGSNLYRQGASRTDTTHQPGRDLIKQNSIDDQIIEFMVDNLKISDSQDAVRQSIANDKYDDLHAIYKLIRDQPDILRNSSATFKIPSLPLIPPSKNEVSKKPSITTGFFNSPTSDLVQKSAKVATQSPFANYNPSQVVCLRRASAERDNRELSAAEQSAALNLVAHLESGQIKDKLPKSMQRQRKSDDQSWQNPPQLFLTPPIENRLRQEANNQFEGQYNVEDNSCMNSEMKPTTARHSFDSTMQQLVCLQNLARPQCDKLPLLNDPRNCSWDSSILDSLGTSTSLLGSGETTAIGTGFGTNPPTAGRVDANGAANFTQLPARNMAVITTNLLQIGTHQEAAGAKNQDLLLAHLNTPPASTAAFSQSGLLPQFNQGEQRGQTPVPAEFTPNNLVNQNYGAVNYFNIPTAQNLQGMLNLNLLDPNGLITGLERRASDGQASYNSLTNTNQPTSDSNQSECQNTSVSPSTMSSSSYQLSSQINLTPQSDVGAGLVHDMTTQGFVDQSNSQAHKPSDMATIFPNDNQGLNIPNDASDPTITPVHEQLNPLDLSKTSKDCSNPIDGSKTANTLEALSFQSHVNPNAGLRSNSTTSASLIFHNSPVPTSPRGSSIISNVANNSSIQIPFCQVSPSSLSLSGGGPGHLLNRRKRHSLETESRHYHCHQQQNHSCHISPKCRYGNNLQHRSSNQQFLKYPVNSHLGQLRNFAQTFSYKNLVRRPNVSPLYPEQQQQPPHQPPVAMDIVTNDNPTVGNVAGISQNPFGTRR